MFFLIKNRETSKFLLTKEYRAGTNQEQFSVPAGMIEDNESPKTALFREIKEETGLEILKPHIISQRVVNVSEGFTNEKNYIFYLEIEGFNKTETNFDGDENLISEWFEYKELKNHISENTNASAVIAYEMTGKENKAEIKTLVEEAIERNEQLHDKGRTLYETVKYSANEKTLKQYKSLSIEEAVRKIENLRNIKNNLKGIQKNSNKLAKSLKKSNELWEIDYYQKLAAKLLDDDETFDQYLFTLKKEETRWYNEILPFVVYYRENVKKNKTIRELIKEVTIKKYRKEKEVEYVSYIDPRLRLEKMYWLNKEEINEFLDSTIGYDLLEKNFYFHLKGGEVLNSEFLIKTKELNDVKKL